MSVTIRPIEEKDKPEWLHLWTEKAGILSFTIRSTKSHLKFQTQLFARFLDANEPVYSVVAVDDSGKIIGFLLTHTEIHGLLKMHFISMICLLVPKADCMVLEEVD